MFEKPTSEQKLFIREKVERLGCLEKVKSFYYRKDLVSQYALSIATKLYATDKAVLRLRERRGK